jgi:cytochrome c553
MKKFLKWALIVVVSLAVVGFGAFLYLIPPFTLAPPEAFSKPAPTVDHIADAATRKIAERGRYIVVSTGCTGCHTAGGENGPNWSKYLAGGTRLGAKGYGTVVARNITPDAETGLARRTDEEVFRVWRSGVLSDGRQIHGRAMPWNAFSNWSEEDMRAVLTYLRNMKPVRQQIPDINLLNDGIDDPAAAESFYGANYSVK